MYFATKPPKRCTVSATHCRHHNARLIMAGPKQSTMYPGWVCDRGDDRCVQMIQSPFMPGISVRHSPDCDDNICGQIFQCDGGNWRVTGQNTLDRSRWLEGWAITQLLTRGFVDC